MLFTRTTLSCAVVSVLVLVIGCESAASRDRRLWTYWTEAVHSNSAQQIERTLDRIETDLCLHDLGGGPVMLLVLKEAEQDRIRQRQSYLDRGFAIATREGLAVSAEVLLAHGAGAKDESVRASALRYASASGLSLPLVSLQ